MNTSQHHTPFGSLMPQRFQGAEKYRFGFNGQEKVDEIKGIGNHNTALFWEYDTRLGRRWNLDPKPQIFISDYAVMGGNPIWFNDPNGDVWDRTKDQKQADKMDVSANSIIKNNNAEITNLQKSGGNEDAINSLQAQNEELQNSIIERAKMGSSSDPTRYRFEKTNGEGGETFKKTNALGENTIIMKFNDEAEAFHEQLHGYKRGQELLDPNTLYGSGYDASEEAAAKRREYSALNSIMRNTRGPLFQKGYFHITTANWVERIRQVSNDPKNPDFKTKNKEYIRIANNWLNENNLPIIE